MGKLRYSSRDYRLRRKSPGIGVVRTNYLERELWDKPSLLIQVVGIIVVAKKAWGSEWSGKIASK